MQQHGDDEYHDRYNNHSENEVLSSNVDKEYSEKDKKVEHDVT